MNNNYIHVTLVCDKSGSMYNSKQDVIGGVKKIIDEQKANKEGKCTISLYTFNEKVNEVFVGKDVNDFDNFEYEPNGLTAMNDGIGTAIDKTGKWLADMREEDRPAKVLVAVFTDGLENASKDYTLERVKEMIKLQENTYSWSFIYLGTDITTTKAADDLGFKLSTYSSRKKLGKNYDIINSAVSAYRCMANAGASTSDSNAVFCSTITEEATLNTKEYEAEIGQKITNV